MEGFICTCKRCIYQSFFSANPLHWLCSGKCFPLVCGLTYFCKTSLQSRIATQGLDLEMESVLVPRTGKISKRGRDSRCPECVNPGPAQRAHSCACLAFCWLWMGHGRCSFITQFWDCKSKLKDNNNERNSLQSATAIRKEEQSPALCVSWFICSFRYSIVLDPDRAVGVCNR